MTHLAIAAARNWLGTPFLAGASVQGVGCDCAGLIEGIARDLGTTFPSRQRVHGDIVAAASALMVPTEQPITGTLILLAAEPGGIPVHAALFSGTGTIIHAHWRAGVVENRFGNWFTRRVTHIFAWPVPSILQDN